MTLRDRMHDVLVWLASMLLSLLAIGFFGGLVYASYLSSNPLPLKPLPQVCPQVKLQLCWDVPSTDLNPTAYTTCVTANPTDPSEGMRFYGPGREGCNIRIAPFLQPEVSR